MDKQQLIKIELISNTTQRAMANTIRFEVFVDEQKVPREIELDQYEDESTHLLAFYNGIPVGTLRFRHTEKGIKIERVAVSSPYRSFGIGKELMFYAEKIIARTYPELPIILHSQISAQSFYEKLGYVKEGNNFMQAGIEHVAMKKRRGNTPS